jgi:cytochrome b subunit of formate dehydrogenase
MSVMLAPLSEGGVGGYEERSSTSGLPDHRARIAVLGLVLAFAGGAAAQTAGPARDPDRRCMQCHGQERIATLGPAERLSLVGTWLDAESPPPAPPSLPPEGAAFTGDEPQVRPGLFIRSGALAGSTHHDLKCVDCHEDAIRLPHEPKLNLETCAATCHAKAATAFPTSSHFEAAQRGDPLAPNCVSCHGGHQIVPVSDRQSPQHRLNSIFLCASCHEKHPNETPGGYNPRLHIQSYLESAHGRAIARGGLIHAPTCSDCHDAHAVHPVDHPDSPVHRSRIHTTCGNCHVGVLNTYQESIHGRLVGEGRDDAPVCTDCHSSHEIIQPDKVAFKLASSDRCGDCHKERTKRYRDTFHGKALALGRPGVAACHDCHGYHDIVPVSDPGSRLAGDQKLATCQQCHPSAGPKFADYIAHADHHDRELYPVLYWTFVFMTMLVVGTFLFFGAHTLLWTARSMALYIRDPQAFREIKRKSVVGGVGGAGGVGGVGEETFVRFRPFERFLHILVMSSFLLLVATGMPLKFYYTGWAQALVDVMGGLEAAAQLHRLGAIITFTYFALHIGSLVLAGVRNRAQFRNPETSRFSLRRFLAVAFGPDLPYPHVQDLKDWWAHQKWFFGRGPRPQFDKWTYWEKFDYLAVFWGVAVIGISGLVLWFPELFTRVLPGWTINIAVIVHSDEALLAAGFIFTFHFFNVHFRPEKFPIDSVIFSGRISRTEMLHERKRWYDRLVASGRLDSVRYRDEWVQWRSVLHPVGYLAFGIGLILLAMIVYAIVSRLLTGH